MRKNNAAILFLSLLNFLFFCTESLSQNIIDPCLTGPVPLNNNDFVSTPNVANIYSSDIVQWIGNDWIGGYTAANLSIPPPINQIGCRAIFLGNGSAWTTGGEQIGLRLDAPFVTGTSYSFNITSISHGLASNGSFSPSFYTNATPSMTGAVLAGSLPAVGNTWTTNTFTFVATAQQNGHTWIILKTEANDSSGLINSFCTTCNQPTGGGCSVTVNSPAICPGNFAAITATPTPAGTYSYSWTVPAGAINPGNVSSFTSNVAGNYAVTITNIVGVCTANASGTVTFTSAPTVTVSSPAVCQGSSATVTATPTPAGIYNYQWTVPVGAANPGNVSSFSSSVAGNYSVVITNPTTNCSSTTATGTVTVNTRPTVTINSATICQGDSATIAAIPNPVGNYSYAWTVPAGVTNPGNVGGLSSAVAGNYAVTITNTVTNCSSISASGTISVNPAPIVSVNSAVICEGDTAILTATPTVAGNYNYQWSVPNGFPNPGNVNSFTATTAGNYSVTVTNPVTNCVSTTASGILEVFPDFEFTINKYCSENNFILEIVPVDNSFVVDTSNITWQVNSTTIGNTGNILNLSAYLSSTPATEALPINIDVSVSSNNGCTKTDFLLVENIYCGIQKGISANNDGDNDFFDLTLLGVDNLSIYNRYGSKVFEKRNYLNEWKGESDGGDNLPDGVYFYLIEFKDNSAAKSGWIYLLKEN